MRAARVIFLGIAFGGGCLVLPVGLISHLPILAIEGAVEAVIGLGFFALLTRAERRADAS